MYLTNTFLQILMIINDLKNSILNRKMLLSMVLGFSCLIIGGSEYLFGYNEGIDFTYMFLFSLSAGTASIIALIYPVLSCLPYADTYIIERNSGYLIHKKLKCNRRKYIISKVVACSVSGGLAVFIPILLYLLLCISLKGSVLIDGGMQYITHLIYIYEKTPAIYCFGYVINSFICGAIFSLIGLSISAFLNNRYLTVFIPLVINILLNIIFSDFLINLNPSLWWDINLYSESNIKFVLAYKISLLLILPIIFLIGTIKNEKE